MVWYRDDFNSMVNTLKALEVLQIMYTMTKTVCFCGEEGCGAPVWVIELEDPDFEEQVTSKFLGNVIDEQAPDVLADGA